jgi:hypothetical protein
MKSQILKLTALALMGAFLAGCSGEVIPSTADDPSSAATITLEKERQRVQRFNCNGELVSDKVETVLSPTKIIEIHPRKEGWTQSLIERSKFYNVQTKDTLGYTLDPVSLTIDKDGSSQYNLHVNPGMNEIIYTFYFTDGTTESQSRYIDVAYRDTLLDGIYYDRPSAESCVD